jgi:hypothetical protein
MPMLTAYGTIERRGKETKRAVNVNGSQSQIKLNYPEVTGKQFQV